MLSLLLACSTAAAVTSGTAGPAEASVHVRTIAWSSLGVHQSVRVYSDDEQPWELALESRPDTWLRSIVGPMFSTVQREVPVPGIGDGDGLEEQAPAAPLGIVTEIDEDASFDLVQWIDTSGQSGAVLAQILAGPRCTLDGQCPQDTAQWPNQPRCPSEASVTSWDGGLLELSRMLVSEGCFTDADVGVQPQSFWVDGWADGQVTLAVQREHCKQGEGACTPQLSFVSFTPPPTWRVWLDDAAAERGHLPRLAPRPSAETAGGEGAANADDDAPHTAELPTLASREGAASGRSSERDVDADL